MSKKGEKEVYEQVKALSARATDLTKSEDVVILCATTSRHTCLWLGGTFTS
jgi:hypothetical protein